MSENETTTDAPAAPTGEDQALREKLIAAVKTVYDPEIPVDIYELGLIYEMDIKGGGRVEILMTLTAPGCPVAGEMPIWVQEAAQSVDGIEEVEVNMTFDPPWDPSLMSDEARLMLGML